MELDKEQEKYVDGIVDMVEKTSFDKYFKEMWVKLYTTDWWRYAYLKIGKVSYYFHWTKDNPVEEVEFENMRGEIKKECILPYDWREANL